MYMYMYWRDNFNIVLIQIIIKSASVEILCKIQVLLFAVVKKKTIREYLDFFIFLLIKIYNC